MKIEVDGYANENYAPAKKSLVISHCEDNTDMIVLTLDDKEIVVSQVDLAKALVCLQA